MPWTTKQRMHYEALIGTLNKIITEQGPSTVLDLDTRNLPGGKLLVDKRASEVQTYLLMLKNLSATPDNTRQLIRCLQSVHAMPDADVPKSTGPRGFPTYIGKSDPDNPESMLPDNEQPEFMEYLATLACAALITDGGRPNFTEIRRVKSAGFHVQAGETDSYGWLTGMIRIPAHGFFVYG